MGIYISMEMPKDCPMCPFAYWDFTAEFRGCQAVKGKKYAMETEPGYPETNFRPSWCPLIELPPHGRLGDLDALAEYVHQQDDWLSETAIHAFCGILCKTPTIIPAEEG